MLGLCKPLERYVNFCRFISRYKLTVFIDYAKIRHHVFKSSSQQLKVLEMVCVVFKKSSYIDAFLFELNNDYACRC